MNRGLLRIFSLIIGIFVFCLGIAAASGDVSIEKISDRLYLVTYQQPFLTHSMVLDTDAGLLLADTGFSSTAEEFKNLIQSKFNKKVLYIINTHHHADHIGGNPLFPGAVIISHENASKRLAEYYHLPRLTTSGQPNITFDSSMKLYIGGIEVRIRYAPGGPTDGDLIVYFPTENILYLDDAIAPDNYNLCDTGANGDPLGMIKNLRGYIDNYPANTRYFFGHGRELNKQDINLYYTDFMKIYDIASKAVKAGKSVKEISESPEITAYDKYAKIFPTLKGNWLRAVESSIRQNTKLPSICEPITQAIMDGGIGKAIELYSKLKVESADKFDFSEGQLNVLGYNLIYRNMLQEALEVIKLNSEMFPDSSNAFDSLGEIQMMLGKNDDALRSYRKSLELNPENQNAAQKIHEIEDKKK
jgi:glyoxylase-like metal-dependent hydrolase (beta-lactamase superfamily II)